METHYITEFLDRHDLTSFLVGVIDYVSANDLRFGTFIACALLFGAWNGWHGSRNHKV